MNITYRKIQKSDFPAVKEIINSSFGVSGYTKNKGMLASCLNSYIQGCLAEATFTSVAVSDGVPIGVIMGNADSDYHFMSHLKPTILNLYYTAKLVIQSLFVEHKNTDYSRTHRIYAELSAAEEQHFDGVLTLFAVSEECRGQGVGKALLNKLFDYLQKNNVTNIYLYTDTTCNVGFYEHQGFKPLQQKEMQVTKHGKKMTLGVYLLGARINERSKKQEMGL